MTLHQTGVTGPSDPQAMLADVDLETAHLVTIGDRAGDCVVSCFWLEAIEQARSEGMTSADWPIAPCAVVRDCPQCQSGGALDPMAHGFRHVTIGGSVLVVVDGVCGLSDSLADGEPRWARDLRRDHGPGLYLVQPAVASDGSLVAVDPVLVFTD